MVILVTMGSAGLGFSSGPFFNIPSVTQESPTKRTKTPAATRMRRLENFDPPDRFAGSFLVLDFATLSARAPRDEVNYKSNLDMLYHVLRRKASAFAGERVRPFIPFRPPWYYIRAAKGAGSWNLPSQPIGRTVRILQNNSNN